MKMFPIQDRTLKSIPWEMIAPHEKQALINHGSYQGLERLAQRSGLDCCEVLAVLDGVSWREAFRMYGDARGGENARNELVRRVKKWEEET